MMRIVCFSSGLLPRKKDMTCIVTHHDVRGKWNTKAVFCLIPSHIHIILRMSKEILHYARLPWPTPWQEFFGVEAPILLEIGFGGGQFLVDLAERRPHCNVLGLEISLPSLRRGAKKLKTSAVRNALVLQANSNAALWLLFKPQSISEVFINFPDPWPKANHHHRRLIDGKFLHLLGSRMRPEGLLEIATDHSDYATVIARCLEDSPYFDSRLDVPFVYDDSERLRTKYEKIALLAGRACHYFKWQRNKRRAPNEFPIPEEDIVPHVVISHPMNIDQIGGQFEPFYEAAGNTYIKYLDMYHSVQERLLLVEIYVNEEPFHQRVCLAIRAREEGDLVVGLHEVGFPRPTPGIHLAVHYLVEWLCSLHTDVKVVGSTLKLPTQTGSYSS